MFRRVFYMLFAITLGGSMLAMGEPIPEVSPKVINWYMVHEPTSVFRHATIKFSQILKEKTGGALQIRIVTKQDMDPSLRNVSDVLKGVQEGKIHMTQTYTNRLATLNKDFLVFDLPFLFRSYDHADKVLEGKTGQNLLASLDNYNLKGLAFTYSGGSRIILTKDKEIKRYEDLKGLRVRVANSPMFKSLYKSIGALGVPLSLDEGYEAVAQGFIEGMEATYVRFLPEYRKDLRVLNDTGHTLFLTTLVINKQFFESLSPPFQRALSEAAIEAGRVERQTTIGDSEALKKSLPKEGIKIVTMTEKERKRFKDKTQAVYKKFAKMRGQQLLTQVLSQ